MQSLLEQYYGRQKKIQTVATIWNVVANDQNNRMPKGAEETRRQQLTYLNGRIRELSNDPQYVQLVNTLYEKKERLSEKDIRSLFLTGVVKSKEYHSKEFLRQFDLAKSKSLAYRHKAKLANSREILSPHLEESFSLAREYSRLYNSSTDAMSVWCDYSEYTMTTQSYENLFDPLIRTCIEIVNHSKSVEKDVSLRIVNYNQKVLKNLLEELLSAVGYNFDQGSLAFIDRPYSENCGPFDERIHIAKGKPLLETILAAMHECGHGLTDMYIDPIYHWTNIHRSLPMGIHESQARGLENMIGRSKPFCMYLEKLLDKYFPSLRDRNAESLYAYLNHIGSGSIRVVADEATYNLHIYIRFLLEKDLFNQTLAMSDVPKRRNELYDKYLGVQPETHNEGCLQDQHWALGLFGYFPTYSLGNIIAGQFWESFTQDNPKRGDEIAKGDFSSYFERYKINVRGPGNIRTTQQTLLMVTGQELTSTPFINYLTKKYL